MGGGACASSDSESDRFRPLRVDLLVTVAAAAADGVSGVAAVFALRPIGRRIDGLERRRGKVNVLVTPGENQLPRPTLRTAGSEEVDSTRGAIVIRMKLIESRWTEMFCTH